jgi:SSS family transporter
MGLLSISDVVVILFYFSLVTITGSWFYRNDADMRAYLLGSKGMRWLPVALSILAADTSAISYLGYPGWSFRENLKLNQNIFTYLFAIPLVMWVFLPVYSRGNLYTAYQYLEQRFDFRVRLLTSLLFLTVRGAHVAIIIYAPALVMAEVMDIPIRLSVLMVGLLTTFYTTMGGIKGVIWTDTIQVMTVFVGFTAVALSALHHVPGGIVEVLHTGRAFGKFEFVDFSFNLDKIDNSWAILIGGTILCLQSMGTDQAVLQKYFTTKSRKETSKALLLYGATIIPFISLLSILGVVLFVFYSKIQI